MDWITTTMVLDSLRNAEEAAWRHFVERFRPAIVRFARDLDLGRDDAEDVAQETLVDFLRAYNDGGYERERGRLSAWLFGIARRRVQNSRRRAGRRPRLMPPGQRTAVLERLPGAGAVRLTWERSWEHAVLEHCLERMRSEVEPRTLEAFEAFAIHGRAAAEVARELGMSSNAVFLAKHRVMRRLVELRREFEAEEPAGGKERGA